MGEGTTSEAASHAFWSGATCEQRLSDVVTEGRGSHEYIDGAAFNLSVGPECYVSPTLDDSDAKTRTAKKLSEGEAFGIPPGQFALVITEEVVKIPNECLGLFSIRSRPKWKGLVNVSGFHVDPGYWGQLTIAVYNAGPTTIQIKRGSPIFLLWLAGLDSNASDKHAKKYSQPRKGISEEVLNLVPAGHDSLHGLSERIDELQDIVADVKATNDTVKIAAWSIVGAGLAVLARHLYNSYPLAERIIINTKDIPM